MFRQAQNKDLSMSNNIMNSTWIRQWPVLVLLGLSFVLAGCNEKTEENATKRQHNNWQLPVTKAMIETRPINYTVTGSVVSDRRVEIASRTAGYIRKIAVREGEKVNKDQPLIMLDNSDVEGAIRQAQAGVNKAESVLKDAETDLKRYKDLFSRDSVSENKMRKTQLQRDIAHDALNEAQAFLHTAIAQRQYISISSPITGIVVARHNREGDLAVPGAPIITVESSQGMLFETYVAESQIAKIMIGDTVSVNIDSLDKPLNGVVARVVPAGDPLTRRYLVKITLPKQGGLLSAMFGRAHFYIGTESMLVIPTEALIERGGLKGVFVLDDKKYINFRWLQIGKILGNTLEVRAGLQEGETIVSVTDSRLRDGDIIKPKETPNE